ncbi:DNA-binding MarR family transcriptional regulator [Saccharothrix tamanrassetensis]|uniref:DNA-binding MarR family transcriptional regulator n=1 Tax=Saccharothrix tamanrassetensis TaxID=1051531 RepID=A0A841C9G0_9PSEU|nr:MarR family transcriptional regulator [Saccharothrix tamanrassetensis]MBB5953791.1 DNA-binding MarR family transcriptional regulator [Saccharothrix tamanrassetensis]
MPDPLTRALTRAVRTVTGHVEQVLRPEGLTLDQWLVLAALAEQRSLTMTELTARTPASGPTVTRVVDKLVSIAAVYREVDPEDRRKVRVYLSPRGRTLHKRLAVKVEEVERDLLGQSGAGVLDLLHRLADS